MVFVACCLICGCVTCVVVGLSVMFNSCFLSLDFYLCLFVVIDCIVVVWWTV